MAEHALSQPADQALLSIADQLTAAGFDIRSPAWEETAYLEITNAPGSLSELTVTSYGTVTWEYRPNHAGYMPPNRPAAIVLSLLDPADRPRSIQAEPQADLTLMSLTGRALAGHGLAVTLDVLDVNQTFYDTYSELRITNPVRPERGTASLASDGTIWWECHTNHPATPKPALSLADISAAIVQALASASSSG
jgi:hypothetical protein